MRATFVADRALRSWQRLCGETPTDEVRDRIAGLARDALANGRVSRSHFPKGLGPFRHDPQTSACWTEDAMHGFLVRRTAHSDIVFDVRVRTTPDLGRGRAQSPPQGDEAGAGFGSPLTSVSGVALPGERTSAYEMAS